MICSVVEVFCCCIDLQTWLARLHTQTLIVDEQCVQVFAISSLKPIGTYIINTSVVALTPGTGSDRRLGLLVFFFDL